MRWLGAILCFLVAALFAAQAMAIIFYRRFSPEAPQLLPRQQVVLVLVICGVTGISIAAMQWGAGILQRRALWRANGRSMLVGSTALLVLGLLLMQVV